MLGIEVTDKFFEKFKNVKAAYSQQEKRYYPENSLEFLLQKAGYCFSIKHFRRLVNDKLLRKMLIFSIKRFLINSFHPVRLEKRENYVKKNIFFSQLYYYQKLALMIRYIFVSQGHKNFSFYHKLMERVKSKYQQMLVTSKDKEKHIEKWIRKYRKINKEVEITRGKKNASTTIAKRKEKPQNQSK